MNAAPFTLQTATPTDLARETRAKADRAELERRQAAPLIGGRIDTTGDLFDQYKADAPLFAAPTPKTKRAHGAPIMPDYMTETPPYPCGLKVGDRVTYTNDAGGMFTGHIIRGFSRQIESGNRFIYLMPRPGSAHWFVHSPESLEKEPAP